MHVNAACGEGYIEVCYGYEGILYAAANGADIINVSWGSPKEEDSEVKFLNQSLDLATDMGALVVAAAGNATRNNDLIRDYPSGYPRALSVGATQKDTRTLALISNYGKLVDVFAPGESIVSTGLNNGYVVQNGTSLSSPLAAGVAALVKTRFPGMSPDAVREQVRLSSEKVDTENPGLAGQLGRGYVNALAAIQPPTLPAVRLKRWSWTDHDGDRTIAPGDAVTVTATVVNYLADARQLKVGLVGAAPYSFIDIVTGEVDVGHLASGDSTEVSFEFRVASDTPANQRVRFYTRIREGAHTDEADMLSFRVNRSLEVIHRSLSALYTATGGDNWAENFGWDITAVPSEEEMKMWFGLIFSEGWLLRINLWTNNLTGTIPPELGDLPQLLQLDLGRNALTGEIPSELGKLAQLLRLRLDRNALTGEIPPALGKLAQLQWLDLTGNVLTGEIPSELGQLARLQELYLNKNALTGEIPPELGQLAAL